MKSNGGWSNQLSRLIETLPAISKYGKAVLSFMKRLTYLDQEIESRQIENTQKYLDLVDKLVVSLREANASEEYIAAVITDLKIPAVQADLEAILVLRKLGYMPRDSSNEAERKAIISSAQRSTHENVVSEQAQVDSDPSHDL